MLTHLSIPLVQNTRNLYFLSSHFSAHSVKHLWKKIRQCYVGRTQNGSCCSGHRQINVVLNVNIFLSVSSSNTINDVWKHVSWGSKSRYVWSGHTGLFLSMHLHSTITTLQVFNTSLHIHILLVGKCHPLGSSDAEVPSPLVRTGCLFLPPWGDAV